MPGLPALIRCFGELTLVAEDGTLSGVYYPGHWTRPDPALFGERSDRGFEEVERQLAEYFAGDRTSFELATSAAGDAFQFLLELEGSLEASERPTPALF